MKIAYMVATVLCSCQLAFAQTSISPTTDPFPEPDNAELPCMVGFTISEGGIGSIQYNTTFSPLLAINPNNTDMLVAVMNQDSLQVSSSVGSTIPRTQEVAIAVSSDGGNTWTTGINIPLHLCLGGLLSNGQSVSSLQYSPLGTTNGSIFIAGSYSDVQNSTDLNSNSGIWVSSSITGGETWSEATIISVQQSNAYQNFTGTADGTPALAFDPHQLSNLYVSWDRPVYSVVSGYPNTIPTAGNIFFGRSNNVGVTWTSPLQIYNITNDIPAGGQCTGVSLIAAVKNKKTKALVNSFMRYFPMPGATTFDKTVATTLTDRVVIRSKDGGATWKKRATIVAPFVYAQEHSPTTANPAMPTFPAPDGSELSHMVVNPVSGRVYLQWQAGSLAISDPTVAQYHPEIVVSVSTSHGKRWSKPVTVSHTPTSLITSNPPAYQAFNGNIFFLPNNLIGILYLDYRNYQANSGVASTDAWLAIYKETESEHGGCTGVGLEFLSEIRLTNPSFDADIATNGSVNGLISGLGNVVGITGVGDTILTAYPVTNQYDPSNITLETYPSVNPTYQASVDTNNRINVILQKVLVATEKSCHESSSSSESAGIAEGKAYWNQLHAKKP